MIGNIITAIMNEGWNDQLSESLTKVIYSPGNFQYDHKGRALKALHTITKRLLSTVELFENSGNPTRSQAETENYKSIGFIDLQASVFKTLSEFIKLGGEARKMSLEALNKYAKASSQAFLDLVGTKDSEEGLIAIANTLPGIKL